MILQSIRIYITSPELFTMPAAFGGVTPTNHKVTDRIKRSARVGIRMLVRICNHVDCLEDVFHGLDG